MSGWRDRKKCAALSTDPHCTKCSTLPTSSDLLKFLEPASQHLRSMKLSNRLSKYAHICWIIAMPLPSLVIISHATINQHHELSSKSASPYVQSLSYRQYIYSQDLSSQITLVTCPGTVIWLKKLSYVPAVVLPTMTTLLSSCNPTAASVPFLLSENCRGSIPPDGASSTKVSFPVVLSIAQTWSVSEGMNLLGTSKSGIKKVWSRRPEVRR